MQKGNTTSSIPSGTTAGAAGFILKSIGAALCGASIPAVVFYFLF